MLLDRVVERVTKAYKDFAFHLVYHELLGFCTVEPLGFYLDILKDRLYCSGAASPERRAADGSFRLADTLVRLMAPVLPFTAEEVWSQLPQRETPSVHMALFPTPSGLKDEDLLERWTRLRDIRESVNKHLEVARKNGLIGKSLEAKVELFPGFFGTFSVNATQTVDHALMKLAKRHEANLPELFIVSSVTIHDQGNSMDIVSVSPATGEKCTRCWTVTQAPVVVQGASLCPRCAAVVR